MFTKGCCWLEICRNEYIWKDNFEAVHFPIGLTKNFLRPNRPRVTKVWPVTRNVVYKNLSSECPLLSQDCPCSFWACSIAAEDSSERSLLLPRWWLLLATQQDIDKKLSVGSYSLVAVLSRVAGQLVSRVVVLAPRKNFGFWERLPGSGVRLQLFAESQLTIQYPLSAS